MVFDNILTLIRHSRGHTDIILLFKAIESFIVSIMSVLYDINWNQVTAFRITRTQREGKSV